MTYFQKLIQDQVSNNVYYEIRPQIEVEVLGNVLTKARYQIRDQVEFQVWNQITAQIENQVDR
jgi:hypothetical protein